MSQAGCWVFAIGGTIMERDKIAGRIVLVGDVLQWHAEGLIEVCLWRRVPLGANRTRRNVWGS